MDESQLLAKVRAGDPAAERALYDAHVDRVYRLAYRMTGDDSLAQDFTQEAFIRAFNKLHTFRGDSALSTWMHTVTTSVVLNGLRKVKKFRTSEIDLEKARAVAGEKARAEPDLRDRLHAPDLVVCPVQRGEDGRVPGSVTVHRGEEGLGGHDAVAPRGDGYRTVFVMHDIEGYTHDEIAGALGVATGTSKAQLSRARAKLRVELADFAEEVVA